MRQVRLHQQGTALSPHTQLCHSSKLEEIHDLHYMTSISGQTTGLIILATRLLFACQRKRLPLPNAIECILIATTMVIMQKRQKLHNHHPHYLSPANEGQNLALRLRNECVVSLIWTINVRYCKRAGRQESKIEDD